jgi:hypothetical protein
MVVGRNRFSGEDTGTLKIGDHQRLRLQQPSRWVHGSGVEPEQHDISIGDDILLPFGA